LTTLPCKKRFVQDSYNKPRIRVYGKTTGNWKTEQFWGTRNVRSLHKSGAALDLVKELEKYGTKCVALQEIRWEDAGSTKVSQTTIFNGKCEKGHKLGTGFAVHESIIHSVKEFRDINPRITTLTIKTDNFDMVLINAHAPTEDKNEEEKELFYATLEDTFSMSKGDIKLVLGDFNAKIGREECHKSTIGNYSLHSSTNDNGTKLIDFALGKGLVVKSTMFQRKDIHKYTWISPNGRHKNQIDHVLINNRFKNSILNIRTLRGADMDSDHLLVGIWMKVKIKKYKKGNLTNKGQTDINKLKDKQICKEYVECFQNIIKGKQLDIERNLNVDKTWEYVKESINEASTKVLGKKVSKTKRSIRFVKKLYKEEN